LYMGNWEIGTAAKILIFAVIAALAVAVVCLAFPEIGAALGGGLNAVTLGLSGMIVGAFQSVFLWGAVDGLTVIVVTASIFIVSVILWELLVKRGVNKLKEKAGITPPVVTPQQPVMTQPTPVVIAEKPVPTKEAEAE
jgi:hypothetical protein